MSPGIDATLKRVGRGRGKYLSIKTAYGLYNVLNYKLSHGIMAKIVCVICTHRSTVILLDSIGGYSNFKSTLVIFKPVW